MDQLGPRAARFSPWFALVLHLLDHARRPGHEEVRPVRCAASVCADSIEIARTVADELAGRFSSLTTASSCTPCPAPEREPQSELNLDWLRFWPWVVTTLICQATAFASWFCSVRRRPARREVARRELDGPIEEADELPESPTSQAEARGGAGPRRPSDRRRLE